MRHRIAALAACLTLLAPATAFAADGGYEKDACTGTAKTLPKLDPGGVVSYCPVATLTQRIEVGSIGDCNWNADTSGTGAGTVTLTAKKCSGTGTAANDCKNLLTDSDANTTITSGSATGYFSIDSGVWLITASGTAANGRLRCTGR